MSYIVHCESGGASNLAGQATTVSSREAADRLRRDWLAQGALRVAVRAVDTTRDWNNRADPVVQAEVERERDEEEGRWWREEGA